jgi:hypothetical protein
MPDGLREALERRAEEEGRSTHATAIQAIERYPVEEADRATVRTPGAGYADVLRRPGE